VAVLDALASMAGLDEDELAEAKQIAAGVYRSWIDFYITRLPELEDELQRLHARLDEHGVPANPRGGPA
jgi:hypothetical protein